MTVVKKISEGIEWKDCPETQALVKGKFNEFVKCTAVSNPSADVTWFKDGQPIDTLRYGLLLNFY